MLLQWKANKNEHGGGPSMCVHSLFKKQILRFSKWSFIVILQFLLLIIMAVWNIKKAIMKDYKIQSCQWLACDRFHKPFLFCIAFRSFLCTVHYILCAFSAKIAAYSSVIDVYFVIISSVYYYSGPCLKTLELKKLHFL